MQFVRLLVLLAACSKNDKDAADAPDRGDGTDTAGSDCSTDPVHAEVAMSDTINTVAFVSWTPPAAGDSWVEYGLDPSALTESTPHVATTAALHEQIVLGMKADRTYSWQAVTEVCGVRVVSEVGTLTTGSPPPGVAVVTHDDAVDDPTRQDPARWMLTITHCGGDGCGAEKPATLVIYDRDGDPVWYYATPSDIREAHTARPSWDGRSVVYGFYDQNQVDDIGGIYRVGMDGRSEIKTPTVEAHHDFVERQDGTFAYLTLDYRENLDVEGEIVNVVSDAILETGEGVDPLVTPPTTIYDQFDDSGQALYWTCSHMRDDFDGQPYKQWSHANSLMPDPVDPDNYYWMNYRYQDSILRVKRDGTIDWEIGGRYGQPLAEGEAFDHGHMSHIWPGGFVIFDNNTHDDDADPSNEPVPSRAREYSYDLANHTVALVRQWDGYSLTPGMADVRRTTAGTVVINFSGDKVIQERTDDDEVIWELKFGNDGMSAGRITLLNNLYDLDDPYAF
jgi:hypothetical protein